ncbi:MULTISPECIES: DUF302 domain-containing protein [unclassified Cryobacterium]|uniref:DUF302 domain-containing protein n=1 Tax=unclassified Cryobacterium TaxID=2649013 RepID=UPI002AB3D2B3|nr:MULTISPECIES: DUF302 domain-containing protein [unclassified Cryobacterium]MDY7530009.1 DUF302 domain-containing protein [Cryobacterium sp. 10C2]MDY7555342.1 DUF302 domain-containing protein [Cryobacterium sp. 10C3]MEB0292534.1 DUF302 domain-containing protein [Cryobacterium sp. 10C2]
MSYTHTVTVSLPYEQSVSRIRELLAEQGFGVLSEINVRSTFEAKLGVDSAQALGDYVILGACNPLLAQRALVAEPDMGVLLPCNVVVRRGPNASETIVQAIDPMTMVQLSDSPAIREVAIDADSRLRAALNSLESTAAGSEGR